MPPFSKLVSWTNAEVRTCMSNCIPSTTVGLTHTLISDKLCWEHISGYMWEWDVCNEMMPYALALYETYYDTDGHELLFVYLSISISNCLRQCSEICSQNKCRKFIDFHRNVWPLTMQLNYINMEQQLSRTRSESGCVILYFRNTWSPELSSKRSLC